LKTINPSILKANFLLFPMLLLIQTALSQSAFEFSRGDIFLKGSLPYLNNFHYDFGASQKKNTGFVGISAGMEVYLNSKYFIEGSIGNMADIFAPIGPIDYDEGEHERLGAVIARSTFNHTNGTFSFGYGLNVGLYYWSLTYKGVPPPTFQKQDELRIGLGPSITAHYHLGPFFAGILYHSMVIDPSYLSDSRYNHVISIEGGFHFRVRKKKD
jgi:hypothetical protein